MGFNKFSISLVLRLLLIMALLFIFSNLIMTSGYVATTLLAGLIIVALFFEVFSFISKTNAEVSRFLNAARYADFSQRFTLRNAGAGFEELGKTFDDILGRFQEARSSQEVELRQLKALIDHVPVPLMSLADDGSIHFWNNAARKLFSSSSVTRFDHLKLYGEGFAKGISEVRVGERKLVILENDGTKQQMMVAVSKITVGGRAEKLISMQDIQSQLDATQLEAWQDLVRVLTHEIMNSITPVASLSKTAVDLVEDEIESKNTEGKNTEGKNTGDGLADIKDAVATIARRSEGLMTFVSSYRRLSHIPALKKNVFLISDLFAQVSRVATINWSELGIELVVNIEPSELDINADRDLIEQVLINLLQNAEQAIRAGTSSATGATGATGATSTADGKVTLQARLNNRGRVAIEVKDNGCGIPADIVGKIFVPFFTSKREGSGVGLALTRQVMIAHGGSVTHSDNEGNGTSFTLTF